MTQGTNADFDSGGFALDPGKYLISVLASGYKIDGEHFTVTESGEFIVEGELVTGLDSSADAAHPAGSGHHAHQGLP